MRKSTILHFAIPAVFFLLALLLNPSPERHREKIRDTMGQRSPVARVLGLGTGERIVGFVHIGTPSLQAPERDRPDPRALLTDWVDSPEAVNATDEALLAGARAGIARLNREYPMDGFARFHLLHRGRRWNPQEGCFMGWERKRGKLHELNRLLRGAGDTSFEKPADPLPLDVRYVVTLDADTKLPIGIVPELVGTALHPLNRARLDPEKRRVTSGYAILQPRVAFSLPVEMERPVFANITRLTAQKGIDLLMQAVGAIVGAGGYVISLGSGEKRYEEFWQRLRDLAPRQVGIYRGYNEPLAHKIEAGADIFLMPSKFEPCGLNQMYSLRYGTVPIVRAVGGLHDTAENFDAVSRTGNGFKFQEYDGGKFIERIYEAMYAFQDKETWTTIQRNGMREDNSWENAARKYLELYSWVSH